MSLIDAIRAVMGPANAAPRAMAPEDKKSLPPEDKARKSADPVDEEAEDEEYLMEGDDTVTGAEDDEDEVEASEEEETVPAARKAERKRIAAILTHPAAATNPSLAAHYAFRTGASVATASAALKAAAATASTSRADQARKRITAGATRLGPDAPRSSTGNLPSIVAAAQSRKGQGILRG